MNFYRSKLHSFQNQKKRVFAGFVSQLSETWLLKFCPELKYVETKGIVLKWISDLLNQH